MKGTDLNQNSSGAAKDSCQQVLEFLHLYTVQITYTEEIEIICTIYDLRVQEKVHNDAI